MIGTLPSALPLRVMLRAREPQRLPPFLGSALHGALGRSLHRTVCALASRQTCRGCPLAERCAYAAMFDAAAPAIAELAEAGIRDEAPRGAVVAPEPGWTRPSGHPVAVAAGAEVPARITLIGRAIDHLPAVIVALRGAAERGLGLPTATGSGTARPSLDLVALTHSLDGQVVYDGASETFTPPAALPPPAERRPLSCDAVTLELVTPLRLKQDGRIAARPTPAALLGALARRANALATIHGDGGRPVDEPAVQLAAATLSQPSSNLRLVHVRRYSSRQGRRMDLPGLMGHVTLAGSALAPLWPLLSFGEDVQVGKGAALGFGRYELGPAGIAQDSASEPREGSP